jgi:hypothetical protein
VRRLVVQALTDADPQAVLERGRKRADLDESSRAALTRIDPDGLTIAALLIARLRFERLIQGSREFAEWFEQDPAACTEAFRRYHHSVKATGIFPLEEARAFEAWSSGAAGEAE